MKRLNWQDWCIEIDQLLFQKNDNSFSALSRQYDHNAAYEQGKSPEEVVKELEAKFQSAAKSQRN